jgi:SnoaL-like domain
VDSGPPLGPDATARDLIDRWIEAVNGRHFELLLDLFGPGYQFVDRRQIGWEQAVGPEETAEIARSFESVSDDFQVSYDWLAGDDRSLAIRLHAKGSAREGGGPFELSLGHIAVVRDGRFIRTEQLDPDDPDAMIARLAELRQELGISP